MCVCPGKGGDYCDTEVFRAECAEGQVVVTQRARYGRMQLGRCVELDLGYIGCQRDVLDIVDRRCSGLRVCEMRIPDAQLEATRACLKELKTYLQVSYLCVTREYSNNLRVYISRTELHEGPIIRALLDPTHENHDPT